MGFGLDSIKSAVSGAVKTVSDVAQKVGDGVQAAEKKVADVVRSAVEGVAGRDGFDNPGLGPVAESKPKGGSASNNTGSSGTAYA
jgi:hypothetical protein